MQQTKMTLQELIDTAEARLADLNYSSKSIYDFHRCWLDLLSYAEERNEKYFSVELGEMYLLERRGIDVLADESTLGLTRSKIRPYKRAIGKAAGSKIPVANSLSAETRHRLHNGCHTFCADSVFCFFYTDAF